MMLDQVHHNPEAFKLQALQLAETLHMDSTVQTVELGGNRQGGQIDIPLSEILPVESRENGFAVGGNPADLLTVLKVGDQNIGIIDTDRSLGTDTEYNYNPNRFKMAKITIKTDQNGSESYAIDTLPDGTEAVTDIANPDDSSKMGRSLQAQALFSIGIDMTQDAHVSATHGTFRFTESGSLHITDERSTNGIGIVLKPSGELAQTQTTNSENISGSEVIIDHESKVTNVAEDLGPAILINEVALTRESALNERQKAIFASLDNTSESTEKEDAYDFDAMLLSEDEYKAKYGTLPNLGSVEEAAVRNNTLNNREVDESSINSAVVALQGNIDPEIKHIIARNVPHVQNAEEIVKQVRENTPLRQELAEFFLGKIKDNLSYMPERIRANSQKSPNHNGYENVGFITSREYASLLALSMLDGTYKFDPKNSDPIIRGEDGNVRVGQHRTAAEILLYN